MRRIDFVITDQLNQKIEEAIARLGIGSKSEFFRVLALNFLKELPQKKNDAFNKNDDALTEKEKTILRNLQKGPQSMDQLIEETGFSITEISVLLTQLLLKNRTTQTGAYWTIKI